MHMLFDVMCRYMKIVTLQMPLTRENIAQKMELTQKP